MVALLDGLNDARYFVFGFQGCRTRIGLITRIRPSKAHNPSSVNINQMSRHPHAFLLACASSTDNFCVGFGLGLSGRTLPFHVNGFISACNAFGALVASVGGQWISSSFQLSSALLGSMAFLVLALQEVLSEDEPGDSKLNDNNKNNSAMFWLALPMTLNNVAGGIAGGSIGIPPIMAFLYAVAASFATMVMGHSLGRSIAQRGRNNNSNNNKTKVASTKLVSAGIYSVLGLWGVWESFGKT